VTRERLAQIVKSEVRDTGVLQLRFAKSGGQAPARHQDRRIADANHWYSL